MPQLLLVRLGAVTAFSVVKNTSSHSLLIESAFGSAPSLNQLMMPRLTTVRLVR
jgi:hypothetical protein